MASPISREAAEAFAAAWLAAWNPHDLDAILAHYAEDVVFVTPMAVKLLGDPSGTVRGRGALRDYFAKGLAAYPDLHFESPQVLLGVNTLTICYVSVNRLPAAEVFELNERALVTRAWAHYGVAD